MPRVVPSQVIGFIDQVFAWAETQEEDFGVNLVRGNSGQLAGLIRLVEQVPEELLTMSSAEYSSFVCSVGAIKDRLALWRAQSPPPELELVFVTGLPHFSPVRLIRDALSSCPDESAAPTTSQLNFITDAALRTSLRIDIGTIDRALSNGEWKAATVLAGSVIEALLLWALKADVGASNAAAAALVGNHTLPVQPPAILESWVLYQFIEVAAHRGMITQPTAIAARLAKDFRNLIHPGRAQRLGQKCDRGAALSAVAALEHVVRDLTP